MPDPTNPVTNTDLQVAMRELREFITKQLSMAKQPEKWLIVPQCATCSFRSLGCRVQRDFIASRGPPFDQWAKDRSLGKRKLK
jgi:hypothetical protein